jgi:hypothetical protein
MRQFPQGPTDINNILAGYGWYALGTLPSELPLPPSLHDSAPSGTGQDGPGVIAARVIRGKDLWEPPTELLEVVVEDCSSFDLSYSQIVPATSWLEVPITQAQKPIYHRVIEGLMALIGWEGLVSSLELDEDGEVDLHVQIRDDTSSPWTSYTVEMKRSDSAYQATFTKPPWTTGPRQDGSLSAAWTGKSKKIMNQVSAW